MRKSGSWFGLAFLALVAAGCGGLDLGALSEPRLKFVNDARVGSLDVYILEGEKDEDDIETIPPDITDIEEGEETRFVEWKEGRFTVIITDEGLKLAEEIEQITFSRGQDVTFRIVPQPGSAADIDLEIDVD